MLIGAGAPPGPSPATGGGVGDVGDLVGGGVELTGAGVGGGVVGVTGGGVLGGGEGAETSKVLDSVVVNSAPDTISTPLTLTVYDPSP